MAGSFFPYLISLVLAIFKKMDRRTPLDLPRGRERTRGEVAAEVTHLRQVCMDMAEAMAEKDQTMVRLAAMAEELGSLSAALGYAQCRQDVLALFPGLDLSSLRLPAARSPTSPPSSRPSEPGGSSGS